MQKKAALLNDTYAWYHWGCTATSSAVRKRISEIGFKGISLPINYTYALRNCPQKIEDFDDSNLFKKARNEKKDLFNTIEMADVVVINGEGTLHHLTKISIALLYLAYASKRYLNKPVAIINHSVYPKNVTSPKEDIAFFLYKMVYEQMDHVAIREHISHSLMRQMGIDAKLSFDCLPITINEDYTPEKIASKKRIVVAGSISFDQEKISDLSKYMKHMKQKGFEIQVLTGAKAFPARDDVQFVEQLKRQDFNDWELINATSLNEWLDCINSASVFVSGRFHHSLAAIFLEIPCVLMESNTLKNTALAETFNFDRPLSYESDNLQDELIERTVKVMGSSPVNGRLLESTLERAEINFLGLKGL